MKLISFAALSLLAITVSAYPGLGSDAQDEQQLQSTSVQGEQGSFHDRVQSEFNELEAEYKKKQELLVTSRNDFESIKKDIRTLKDLMANAEAKLENTNLSDEQRSTLEQNVVIMRGKRTNYFPNSSIQPSLIQRPSKSVILSRKKWTHWPQPCNN
ncbi:hypothetical protein BASA61_000680 [Batrachochytrium salamandrivorans]|nr:hypothetical protein BASA61_000680 [Batrachochytrium salamandrivorans]